MSTATRPRSSLLRLGPAHAHAHPQPDTAPQVKIQWLRAAAPKAAHHVLFLGEPDLYPVHRDISRGGNVGCRGRYAGCPQCARGLELRYHWYAPVKMHVVGDQLGGRTPAARWFYAVYAVPPESAGAFGFLAVEKPDPADPGRNRRRFVPRPVAGTCRRFIRKPDGQLEGQPLALHSPAEVTTFDMDAVLDRTWFGQKYADSPEDREFYEANYMAALSHLAGPCPGPDVMSEWHAAKDLPPDHVRLMRTVAAELVREERAKANAAEVQRQAREHKEKIAASMAMPGDTGVSPPADAEQKLLDKGHTVKYAAGPTARAAVDRNRQEAKRRQAGEGGAA